MNSQRRGFTLIELLVVIAIIAILAAIIFPSFLRAKKSGQAASCLGNVKQLGFAATMYADDNNGCMVPTVCEPDGNKVGKAAYLAGYRTWRALLWRYVKSEGAYYCPAMRQEAVMWRGWDQVAYSELVPQVNDVPSTYAVNNCVTGNASWAQGFYTFKISAYPRPSRILLLTEVRNGIWNTNPSIMAKATIRTYAPLFHYNKINVAFVDGHAKTMYLYDTIGNTPAGWMWWDPQTNGVWGDLTEIARQQDMYKRQWPKNYPPLGGD